MNIKKDQQYSERLAEHCPEFSEQISDLPTLHGAWCCYNKATFTKVNASKVPAEDSPVGYSILPFFL
jgi:hypothetical protein